MSRQDPPTAREAEIARALNPWNANASMRFSHRTPEGNPVYAHRGKAYEIGPRGEVREYANANREQNARIHHDLVAHGVPARGTTPLGRTLYANARLGGYFTYSNRQPRPYRLDEHLIESRESRRPLRGVLPDSRFAPPAADPAGLVTRFGKFELQPHQVNASRLFVKPDVPGLLLYYKVGSGKTLAAIAAVENYRRLVDPRARAVFVAPTSLIANFEKEAAAAGVDLRNYEMKTFKAISEMPDHKIEQECAGKVLVVDEAHNARNETTKTAKALLTASGVAAKRLLLTGTPVMNDPSDVAMLLRIVDPSDEMQKAMKDFDQYFGKDGLRLSSRPALRRLLRCKTLFYEPPREVVERDYPRVVEHVVKVEMNRDMIAAQRQEAGDRPHAFKLAIGEMLTPFLTKPRMLNTIGDTVDDEAGALTRYPNHPKITVAARHIAEAYARRKKSIAFTTYRAAVRILMEELIALGVAPSHVAIFDGSVPKSMRSTLVRRYNAANDDPEGLKVLLLTSAGGEGLDLKNTAQVHIIEPNFNWEKTDQSIARAVRFKSHADLPPAQRKVDVYKYYMHMGGPGSGGDRVTLATYSADEILEQICEVKRISCAAFVDEVLIPTSDENVRTC